MFFKLLSLLRWLYFRLNSASTNGADIEDEIDENNKESRPLAAKKRSVRISDDIDILSNGDGSGVASDSVRKGTLLIG